MVGITVTVTGIDSVQRELSRIASDLRRDQALAAAINKTADKARAEVTRAVTETYAIKADLVRNSLYLRRASARSDIVSAVIDIFGSPSKKGRSMNMARFLAAVQAGGAGHRMRGGRATKKQIAALAGQLGFQIKSAGGLKTIAGAFLGNKGRTVFMRTGKGRLPIACQRLSVSSD